MEFIISDTSVLIDLERGDLLGATFQLDIEFIVPDLLYVRELQPYNGGELVDMGLHVQSLDDGETTLAQQYQNTVPALSLPDSFALALAKKRDWHLLTGDQHLRTLAEAEDVTCNGVLWVLDGILDNDLMNGTDLTSALNQIADHPRCRLPLSEIRSRQRRYVKR